MSDEKLDELIRIVKDFALQNEDREKRAAELIIANRELAFPNREKENRASELVVANIELAFQNQEKEKRASELILANEELDFQNREKEKRAKELINANKELEKLLQLNTDKDLFISILAHDLKSPFNAILGLSELLMENLRTYNMEEIEEIITMLNKSAKNTLALLEDLLKWAIMQSGKIPYNPQKLNFAEICMDFHEIFKANADYKNITINCLAESDIDFIADIDMFKVVFRNIVTNSIKFTGNNGRIDIAAFHDLEYVTISISDTGIGISPENLTKLFDLSQIQTTKGTAEETGTGLGLVLCKEFVEKHGGQIWAESKLGRGSKFLFTMPVYKVQ